jgi:hypothetical protein
VVRLLVLLPYVVLVISLSQNVLILVAGDFKNNYKLILFVCVGFMYSGEYDVCDVTLSVHPHRANRKVCLTTAGIEPATFIKKLTHSLLINLFI